MRKLLVLIALLAITLSEQVLAQGLTQVGQTTLAGPVGEGNAQYSPWVMHEPGWSSYVTYYCKDTEIDGVHRDKVWRRENYSIDGMSGTWGDEQIVVQGTSTKDTDDYSCDPGVVIDKRPGKNNKWRMYYVTARRTTSTDPEVIGKEMCKVWLHYAEADAPGINWTKKGPINIEGLQQPVENCYFNAPSPMVVNDKIVVYFAGWGGLWKLESNDGVNFTKKQANIGETISSGRVKYINGIYYFSYVKPKSGQWWVDWPDEIWLRTSTDGINFNNPIKVYETTDGGLDSACTMAPDILVENGIWKFYYGANTKKTPNCMSNSSLVGRFYEAPNCRVQGFKVVGNDKSNSDVVPMKITCSGGGEVKETTSQPVILNMKAGQVSCRAQIPSGEWKTGYTLALGSTGGHNLNPTYSNPVTFNCAGGSYADLWWHYEKQAAPSSPVKLSGDASGDGRVDLTDQAIWKKEYVEGVGKSADFDGNGKVDMTDLGIWKTEYVK